MSHFSNLLTNIPSLCSLCPWKIPLYWRCKPLTYSRLWFSLGFAIWKVPGTNSRLWPQLALLNPKYRKPSCSPILIAGKPVEGGAWISAPVVATHATGMSRHSRSDKFNCVVLLRTSTDRHSSHTFFNAQVSCLSPWSLRLCHQYSFSYAHISTAHLPILPLTAILKVAAKEQPDMTSRQLNSLANSCVQLVYSIITG